MLSDAEREDQIRQHVERVAVMCGAEAELVQGHVTFLLRQLDKARDEVGEQRLRIAARVRAVSVLRLEAGRDPLEQMNEVLADVADDIEFDWADYDEE